jgi:hypothetical protein
VVNILLLEIIKTCHKHQLLGTSPSVVVIFVLRSSPPESKSSIPSIVLEPLKSMAAWGVQQPYQCDRHLPEARSRHHPYPEKRIVTLVDRPRLETVIDLEDINLPSSLPQG